jgi:hypothetical protein
MSTVKSLIAEIEAFCKEADIAEATFGTRAAKDGKFVKRLRGGAGVTLSTVERVQAYMADQRKMLARPKRRRPADDRRAA